MAKPRSITPCSVPRPANQEIANVFLYHKKRSF
jgi:hypothetical protein